MEIAVTFLLASVCLTKATDAPDVDAAKKAVECAWSEVEFMRNSGNEVITLTGMTLETCKEACVAREDINCLSIEFNSATKDCFLQEVNRRTHSLKVTDVNYIYADRNCDQHYPQECQWETVTDFYMGHRNEATIFSTTIDICKKYCEEAETFFCRSFDFYEPTKTCFVKLVSRYEKHLTAGVSYVYYERNCYDKFRSCPISQLHDTEWEKPLHGVKLAGVHSLQMTKATPEQCKQACIQQTTFHCLGFNYDNANDRCFLGPLSEEFGGYLTDTSYYSYYKLVSCPESDPIAPPKNDCKWLPTGYGLFGGNHRKLLIGIPFHECKKACEEEKTFFCASIVYSRTSSFCSMKAYSKDKNKVEYSLSFFYAERECEGSVGHTETCEWEGPYKEKYISGRDYMTLTGMTVESCKAACEADTIFNCHSFDITTSGTCLLSYEDLYTAKLSFNEEYSYYERQCRDEYRNCFAGAKATWKKVQHGLYISGYDHFTLSKTTVDRCKEACVQAEGRSFRCTSFDFNRSTQTCYLQGVNSKSYSLAVNGDYDYYELEKCDGERPIPGEIDEMENECHWEGPYEYKYSSGRFKDLLHNINSDEACMKECEKEPACKAVNYYVTLNWCYLEENDRFSAKLSEITLHLKYYERQCFDWFDRDCTWEGPYKHRYISGHDHRTVYANTIQECKETCEQETDFHCLSFDYHIKYRRCFLSYESRYGQKLSTSTLYSYYERNCRENYKYCEYDSDAVWAAVKRGFYINSAYTTLANMKTPDDCKKACLADQEGHCLAVNYAVSDGTCFFLQKTPDNGGVLIEHESYDYYQLIACPKKNSTGTQIQGNCKWLDPVVGKYIEREYILTLFGMDIEGCKAACEAADSFDCKSFNWYPHIIHGNTGFTCFLNNVDRGSVALSSSTSYTYYERDCSPYWTEQCEWEPVKRNKYIVGNDHRTLKAVTVEECREACEKEADFYCMSFDYYRPSKRCYLSRYNLLSGSTRLTDRQDYDYYERTCVENLRNCGPGASAVWEGPFHGMAISGMDQESYPETSIEGCKLACLRETSFHCRSFDYDRGTKTCYLQARNRITDILTPTPARDYYEIKKCAPLESTEDSYIQCSDESSNHWAKPLTGKYISGNDIKTLTYMTIEECKAACVQQTTFHCISMEFNRVSNTCYLQAVVEGPDTELKDSTTTDYYLLKECVTLENQTTSIIEDAAEGNADVDANACKPGAEAAWLGPIYGASLKGFTNHKTIHDLTVEQCKDACLQTKSFHCRSLRWKRSNHFCCLSAYSSDDHEITNDMNYDYYQLIECKEDRPEWKDGNDAEGRIARIPSKDLVP